MIESVYSCLLPATEVTEDHQGIREAIQVVIPKVQGRGLARHKAPHGFPPLEIKQHWHPLQQHANKNDTLIRIT